MPKRKKKNRHSAKINTPPVATAQTLQSAIQHHQAGQLQQAEKFYRQVLEKQPSHHDALHLLGIIAAQTGRHEEAIQLIQKAITVNREIPNFYNSLGNVLQIKGNYQEAETVYQQALALDPNVVEAHYNLAQVLKAQNKLEEAVASYQRVVALNPNHIEAYNNLGTILKDMQRLEEAKTYLLKALTLNPQYTEAHYNLGNVYWEQEQEDEAIACYQRALTLKPNYTKAYNNLGTIFWQRGELSKAIACYQKALSLDSNYVESLCNMANALQDKGQVEEALPYYRKSLALSHFAPVHSNLLFALLCCENYNRAQLFAEHCQFDQQQVVPLKTTRHPHQNIPDPHRKLKIGYISPDFWQHAVASFTIGIFAHHNREQFEIYGYHIGTKTDNLTTQFQGYAHHWLHDLQLSDEALAEQIRQDQIDILVDLAGHTAHNRLLVLAYKPAPIQVTYLGYSETTGVSTIDYRITDGFADPVEVAEPFSSETLIRMPTSYFCYTPTADSPPVDTLPALRQGYITFGSFNNYKKITPTMLKNWAMILNQVPDSRLFFKNKSLNDLELQQHVKDYFAKFAIAPERIIIGSYASSITAHLAIYNQIDIALDTYPYNGATTTCEALWMGVPVVTRVGERHVSRMGLSLLSAISLTECVANTTEDYINSCVKLTKDLDHLQHLRATMRDRLRASPLLDAPTFTHQLEIIYQQMWEKWCTHLSG